MAEIGLKVRTDGQRFESFNAVALTPGVVAGQMDLIHDTVGVYAQTAATGEDVAFIYNCKKIVVPKEEGSTNGIISAGDKVFFDHANAEVTADSSGNLWCGIALEDAGAADCEILIDLKGDKAHS
jgi:hypothetical protein